MSSIKQDQSQAQAVFQKPVKYLENVWGQDVRADVHKKNWDMEADLRNGHWSMRDETITGQLPYSTTPRLKHTPDRQFLPVDTRVPRSCFNECLAQSGPWYLRGAPILDYAPILPTRGDVSLDLSKGSLFTRQFTQSYKAPGL